MAARHADLDGLARALLESLLQQDPEADPQERLGALVALCRRWIPGASWVSISVRRRDSVRTDAATDPQATRLDELQYASASGPCLAALADAQVQFVPDLAAEPLWPDWWSRVQEEGLGLAGVLSRPLTARGSDPGMSLNIYARRAGAIDEVSLAASELVAAYAAAVAQAARSREEVLNLRRAVDSNRQVGIATGVLMALRKLEADAAFELLRSTSQETNRKLTEVAQEVSRTGTLPAPPPRSARARKPGRGQQRS